MLRPSSRSSLRRVAGGLGSLIALAASASATVSCRDPSRTGLLVLVRAHDFPATPAAFDSLRIEVTDLTGGGMRVVHNEVYTHVDAAALERTPFDFSLVPVSGGAEQLLRVQVTAVDRGSDVVSAQAVTRYLAQQVRRLDIDLWNPCRASAGVTCPEVPGATSPMLRYQTCVARLADPTSAHCESAYRDPETLDRVNPDGSVSPGEASVRDDAAADAPADVASDTAADAAVDAAVDAAGDAPVDAAPDAPTDVALDAPVDVAPDAPADVAPADAPVDARADAIDATPDAAPDVPPPMDVVDVVDVVATDVAPMDVAPDGPPDAGPEAGPDAAPDAGVDASSPACVALPAAPTNADCAPPGTAGTAACRSVSLNGYGRPGRCALALGGGISVSSMQPASGGSSRYYAVGWSESAATSCEQSAVYVRRFRTPVMSMMMMPPPPSIVAAEDAAAIPLATGSARRTKPVLLYTDSQLVTFWLEQSGASGVSLRGARVTADVTSTAITPMDLGPIAASQMDGNARLEGTYFAMANYDTAGGSLGPTAMLCAQATAAAAIQCFAVRLDTASPRVVGSPTLTTPAPGTAERLVAVGPFGNGPNTVGSPLQILTAQVSTGGTRLVAHQWAMGSMGPAPTSTQPALSDPIVESISGLYLAPRGCSASVPSEPMWNIAYVSGSSRLRVGRTTSSSAVFEGDAGPVNGVAREARTAMSTPNSGCRYVVATRDSLGGVTVRGVSVEMPSTVYVTETVDPATGSSPIAMLPIAHGPPGIAPAPLAGPMPDLYGIAYFTATSPTGPLGAPTLTVRWTEGTTCP